FVGTLNWYPNQEAIRYFLSDVWPQLLADDPERRLTVIGRDPPPFLLAAARSGTVSAPGFVDDVRSYLADAAIYICPIRDGGGTRLKVLDALAMGKPVVGTGLAVEGLDLVEEEHYLRAESPDAYVRQIRRLEKDPALRERLGRTGRRLVEERYSWDVIATKLCEAYELARRTASSGRG
ncbi:MAG TPA: glycosyltransferase family 4 protein, partial [Gemmatimonadales bacterium]|nr:glycosyltransferase family 4 protein [Gemmatimonadales bacterium]